MIPLNDELTYEHNYFQEEEEMKENRLLTTKNVVLMGMFGALAGVLMVFELPLPFIAPVSYTHLEYQNRLAWTIHMGIMQYLNSQ